MNEEILILMATAASIGFFHTLLGPDHYLPFIVMARSGKWSQTKTLFITFLCGLGHVLGSVVLGLLGVGLGVALARLELIESVRGELAAWFLIAFGLVYFVWGMRRAARNKPHKHIHAHEDGDLHVHEHVHKNEHLHVHTKEDVKKLTPWVLFIIFVLGPCEPLIPILMFPASQHNILGLILVTLVFGVVTILTMMGIVFIASHWVSYIPSGKMERYMHAIAGATISLSGLAIQFLGL